MSTLKSLALFGALIMATVNVYAGQPAVCALLKKEKKPAMYLLDKDGKVSKGPVDLGTYAYVYEPRDMVKIPTNYRLVIYPRRIQYESPNQAHTDGSTLTPTKSVCPNSRTYMIGFHWREFRVGKGYSDMGDVEKYYKEMPLKIDEFIRPDFIENLANGFTDYYINPICRFDCRIVGTIVDGRKKQ